MVLILLAMFFCLLYFPPRPEDTAQCYFLSPAAALSNVHPAHLTRYLSPRSQSSVSILLSQLLVHCTKIFTFLSQAGQGAAQGQGPEYSTVAWGRRPQRVQISKEIKASGAHTYPSLLFPAFLNLCLLLMTIKLSQADCAMLPQGACSRLRVNCITVLQRGLISSVQGGRHEERKAL